MLCCGNKTRLNLSASSLWFWVQQWQDVANYTSNYLFKCMFTYLIWSGPWNCSVLTSSKPVPILTSFEQNHCIQINEAIAQGILQKKIFSNMSIRCCNLHQHFPTYDTQRDVVTYCTLSKGKPGIFGKQLFAFYTNTFLPKMLWIVHWLDQGKGVSV